jgi:hypothetical protein
MGFYSVRVASLGLTKTNGPPDILIARTVSASFLFIAGLVVPFVVLFTALGKPFGA